MDTRTSSRTRRIVAFVGHAPALRLCYRQRLSPQLRRANAIAAGLTLIVLSVALFLAPPTINKLSVALVVWAPCHMAWGAYLAWRL